MKHPVTPDGRYFVVRGRLWRMSDPGLDDATRARLTHQLMDARRAVARAKRKDDAQALALARAGVQRAKVSLGERGQPWWTDGTQDFNRRMARDTPYASWYAALDGNAH